MSPTSNGFTLIELVVTLAIIGLISALILPNFGLLQKKAKASTLKSVSHTFQMALESYHLENGNYPLGTGLSIKGLSDALIQTQDLKKTPINPYTGKAFTDSDTAGTGSYTSNGSGYSLTFYGESTAETIIQVSD
ncbi:MAG: type II secretion system protein [Candidatus Margulisiibacteriota bacterium]